MSKGLRYGLIGAGALVAVILALPFVVPMDVYRVRLENAAGRATGRSLHIEGPLRLMLFPHFGLRAEQVTFANIPGGRAAAMARVGDIRLAIRFLPLLTGHLEIEQIVLDRPDIELEVDAKGQSNWTFAKSRTARAAHGSSVTLPLDTKFSGIKINDGRVAYSNARTGVRRALDHVNANIAVTRLDQPVSMEGNLSVAGRRIDFEGRVVTIKTLLSDEPTLVDMSLTSALMQLSFKGNLMPDGTVDGSAKLDTPSLRSMAQWLGWKISSGGGLGPLSLEGQFTSKNKITTLDPIKLSLDGANMRGKLSIDAHDTPTQISGALWIDRLDLNPYLQTAGHKPSPARKPEPGWSKAPINLAWLKEANADLALDIGPLRLRNLHLGHTVGHLTIKDAALTARLDSIALYGGHGRAQLALDASGAVPRFRNDLQFDRIALRPFLGDTMGVDRIEGTASIGLESRLVRRKSRRGDARPVGKRNHRRRPRPDSWCRSRHRGAHHSHHFGRRREPRRGEHRFLQHGCQFCCRPGRPHYEGFQSLRSGAAGDGGRRYRDRRSHARHACRTKSQPWRATRIER